VTTLEQVEKLALNLPERDRAKLATHLLESLPSALEEEEDAGLSEAIRRDAELDADPKHAISLEEFDAQSRRRRK
jgi:putative addiction module component (TIGR02574 family)